MIRGTDHFGHQEAAGIVAGLFWDRRDLHDEFAWTLRTGATELALSCTRQPGQRRSRPSITRSRRGPARERREQGPGLTRSCCLRQEGQITAADTTRQPSTIGLIRGLWVIPLSFERWVKRFENLGQFRDRPASHSQRHLTNRGETDRQNHRQQPMRDSHMVDLRRKPRRCADTANGVRT